MISNRSADLGWTLNSVAESAARLCDADDAVILRIEEDHLCVASHYGSLSTVSIGQPFPIRNDWLSGRTFNERATVNVCDMALESCVDFDNQTPRNGEGYRSALTA